MKFMPMLTCIGAVAAAPAPGSFTGQPRPTGTGGPAPHGHDRPGPPFPAFPGGHHSFSGTLPPLTGGYPRPTDFPPQSVVGRGLPRPNGTRSLTRTGNRPEHTGIPHSFDGSNLPPKPTNSLVHGDPRPGGWPGPGRGGFLSASGIHPSFTPSQPTSSQPA